MEQLIIIDEYFQLKLRNLFPIFIFLLSFFSINVRLGVLMAFVTALVIVTKAKEVSCIVTQVCSQMLQAYFFINQQSDD